MPNRRFYRLSLDARAQLLAIALQEFAAHGFADASLNHILSAAKISKGSYYYYFDDKKDLFVTTVATAFDDILARATLPSFDELTPRTFWPAMARAAVEWRQLFAPAHELLKAIRSFQGNDLAAVLDKGRRFWLLCIEAGQRLGCIRKDLASDVLVSLVEANDHALDTAFLAAHPHPSPRAFAAHVDMAFDVWKRVLIAPKKKGRP